MEWDTFCAFKNEFLSKIDEWNKKCLENKVDLLKIQKKVALENGTPDYSFETPIVYNKDLDLISKDDEIKLIVIGDNPGKDEQLLKNNRYLVGQAGKIAEGFFRRNSELNIDFRKNVIILNKTPVHSAKTNQLRQISKQGGKFVDELILETQEWMAKKTAELHKKMCACGSDLQIWLVGYSELKEKGIFAPYRNVFKAEYGKSRSDWDRVFVFQHFSMNRFTIDLENKKDESKSLIENIRIVGNEHKKEIFDLF